MGMIAYTVAATLPDDRVRDDYVAWLTGGHLAAVLVGGATSAQVVSIAEPVAPITVEVRYMFPAKDALDRYLREFAPALRAEGLARFGSLVTFRRSVGEIVANLPARPAR